MAPISREQRSGIIRDFASRLRFPYLFFLLAILFLVDLIIPDLIPFIDEAVLGVLSALFASWKGRKEARPGRPADKITPAK